MPPQLQVILATRPLRMGLGSQHRQVEIRTLIVGVEVPERVQAQQTTHRLPW